MKSGNLDPYENLANAIVLDAVKDYRKALKRLRKNSRNSIAASERDEIERFFHSPWFGVLTTVDPEYLITKLKEEVFG